jgi:hypothetical protein
MFAAGTESSAAPKSPPAVVHDVVEFAFCQVVADSTKVLLSACALSWAALPS